MVNNLEPKNSGMSTSRRIEGFFVDYLNLASSQDFIKAYKQRMFSLQSLKPADHVLDVGCGTGEDVVSLSKIVGHKGRAVGIDNSEAMISEAKSRAARLNLTNVDFILGRAEEIDFPDEAFDGSRADRVFQHLSEPMKALGEIIRVTRKGSGRIVVCDADYDTLTIDSEFKDITRQIITARTDSLKNGWSGRRLHGMFKEAGLIDVSVSGFSTVLTDYDLSFRLLGLEAVAKEAVEMGVISSEGLTRWASDLRRRQELGRYFCSVTGFIVAGRRSS